MAAGFHPAGHHGVYAAGLQGNSLGHGGGGPQHLDAPAVGLFHNVRGRNTEHKAHDGGTGFQRGLHLFAVVGQVSGRHGGQWQAEFIEVRLQGCGVPVEVGLRDGRGFRPGGNPQVQGKRLICCCPQFGGRLPDGGGVVTVQAVGTQPAAVGCHPRLNPTAATTAT